MSYEVTKFDLLYETSIPVNEFISFKNPKLEEIVRDKSFASYSRIFTISTREIFSQSPHVDELEQKYPTLISILQDPQLTQTNFLGHYFAGGQLTGEEFLFKSFEFWTGVDSSNFKILSNGKIICTSPEWIIDEEEFENISDLIKMITSYEPNEDFIAPPNMTPNRHKRWMALVSGRIDKVRKDKSELADKILILSVSTHGYIPIEEIRKMTFYHFQALLRLTSTKVSYEQVMALKNSPKFDVKDNPKHWMEFVI